MPSAIENEVYDVVVIGGGLSDLSAATQLVKAGKSTSRYCALADNTTSEDSILVKSLKAAGAIVFVKTTMPVTGMALETTSNLYGRTYCSHNRLLVSGASSGGEGSLVGIRGSPLGIGTDIGRSIRIPCAFNGIYGIRPSTGRLSYAGITSNVKGQVAIAAAIGPMANSIRDLELICKVATDAKPWYSNINVDNREWTARRKFEGKLTVGIVKFDGVIMPHPPILRALDRAAKLLADAGHEVIEFEQYQHQRAWDIVYPLYYATGGKEMAELLAQTGEPWLPSAKKLGANPSVRELKVKELFNLHAARDQYKMEYLKHWNSTASKTASGHPINVLIWWGYASQFNLLDYPGVIIPVGFVDSKVDLKYPEYKPVGSKDQENYDLYDPELSHNAPVSVQLVGRSSEGEGLLACAATIDEIVKNGRLKCKERSK